MAPAVNVDDAFVESGLVDVQEKCTSVVLVLRFLHEELFAGATGMIHRFEDFMWKIPGNLEAQLMNMLQDEIPHDATALDAYRKVLVDTVSRRHSFRGLYRGLISSVLSSLAGCELGRQLDSHWLFVLQQQPATRFRR